jgi:hypothetical protein
LKLREPLVLQIRFPRLLPVVSAFVVLGMSFNGGSIASACTVPVFRFALERWAADRYLVIVYYNGHLTAEQNSAFGQLVEQSSVAGGPLNIETIRYDVASPPPGKLFDIEPPSADQSLPCVEVRKRLDWAHTALRWRGSLTDAIERPGLFDSPARSEIVRRILEGHSSVWLLIAPEEQAKELSEQLQGKLDGVTKNLTLPKGIGLPGSELYTSIPLEIRCSVLGISHADPKEQQFLKLLAASAPEWKPDAAYVVPIFGRCRAMEVIPHWEIDEVAIEDIANFFCNACSCQVKQANPGFDLLASVNWEDRLFGGSIPEAIRPQAQPLAANDSVGAPVSPEYVAIPVGEATNASAASDGEISLTKPDQSSSAMTKMLLVAVVALISGGILRGALRLLR